MALFFLVVGLEIKREVVRGELRILRTSLLPIGAAIGGMIVPATIFLVFNYNQPENINGWAIPVATDIAFALGVISLLGRRVPSSLKVFLLTIAVVDDIIAILIIALFYGNGFDLMPLAAAGLIALGIFLSRNTRYLSLPLFAILGIAMWAAVYQSGIHASITGAFLGFLAPLAAYRNTSVAERLERYTIPIATFVVVPLFAFANLGIVLSINSVRGEGAMPLVWGIIGGLVLGKVVGITLATWLLTKLKISELPPNTTWLQIIGVGLIAGIGFTVSVFITELSFVGNQELTDVAKLSIVIASTICAVGGYAFLRYRKKVKTFLETEIEI